MTLSLLRLQTTTTLACIPDKPDKGVTSQIYKQFIPLSSSSLRGLVDRELASRPSNPGSNLLGTKLFFFSFYSSIFFWQAGRQAGRQAGMHALDLYLPLLNHSALAVYLFRSIPIKYHWCRFTHKIALHVHIHVENRNLSNPFGAR